MESLHETPRNSDLYAVSEFDPNHTLRLNKRRGDSLRQRMPLGLGDRRIYLSVRRHDRVTTSAHCASSPIHQQVDRTPSRQRPTRASPRSVSRDGRRSVVPVRQIRHPADQRLPRHYRRTRAHAVGRDPPDTRESGPRRREPWTRHNTQAAWVMQWSDVQHGSRGLSSVAAACHPCAVAAVPQKRSGDRSKTVPALHSPTTHPERVRPSSTS